MVRDVLFTLLAILDPDNRQSWKNVLKVVSSQPEAVSANIFQEKILFSFIFVFADMSLEKNHLPPSLEIDIFFILVRKFLDSAPM